MVALEQKIVEKFWLLDKEAQQRVLKALTMQASTFDWLTWFEDTEALHTQSEKGHGELPPIDVVRLLREVREEDS